MFDNVGDLIEAAAIRAAEAAVEKFRLNPPPPRTWTDEKGAAKYLGMKSPRALEVWRRDGLGPKFRKLSPRHHIFAYSDLDAFAESFRLIDPAEAGE